MNFLFPPEVLDSGQYNNIQAVRTQFVRTNKSIKCDHPEQVTSLNLLSYQILCGFMLINLLRAK